MSHNIISLRKSEIPDRKPNTSLEIGELAINLTDKKIYSKTSLDEIIQLGSGSLLGLDDVSNVMPVDKQFLQFDDNSQSFQHVTLSPSIDIVLDGIALGNTTITLQDLKSDSVTVDLESNVQANVNYNYVNAIGFVGFGTGFSNIDTILSGSGTYNLPSGIKKFKVTGVGGGGQGGGTSTVLLGGAGRTGGGGQSGGVFVKIFNIVDGVNSFTYSVGAAGSGAGADQNGNHGGNTTITYNSINLLAEGGEGGFRSDNSDGGGKNRGSASGGDLNFDGFPGQTGNNSTASNNNGIGYGGSTPLGLGQGACAPGGDSARNGLPGTGYGSAGSGAKNGSSLGTTRAGGPGANGIIIVEW